MTANIDKTKGFTTNTFKTEIQIGINTQIIRTTEKTEEEGKTTKKK